MGNRTIPPETIATPDNYLPTNSPLDNSPRKIIPMQIAPGQSPPGQLPPMPIALGQLHPVSIPPVSCSFLLNWHQLDKTVMCIIKLFFKECYLYFQVQRLF